MSNITIDLGQRIKAYRSKSNLSLRDLAVLTGISPSTLCRIENGEVNWDRPTEDRILSWIEGGVKLPEIKSLNERLVAIESRLAEVEKRLSK